MPKKKNTRGKNGYEANTEANKKSKRTTRKKVRPSVVANGKREPTEEELDKEMARALANLDEADFYEDILIQKRANAATREGFLKLLGDDRPFGWRGYGGNRTSAPYILGYVEGHKRPNAKMFRGWAINGSEESKEASEDYMRGQADGRRDGREGKASKFSAANAKQAFNDYYGRN